MELPNNTEFLKNVILPRVQEIQRDVVGKSEFLTVDVDINVGCVLISVTTTLYSGGKIFESKSFGFHACCEISELEEEYSKLIGYVKRNA